MDILEAVTELEERPRDEKFEGRVKPSIIGICEKMHISCLKGRSPGDDRGIGNNAVPNTPRWPGRRGVDVRRRGGKRFAEQRRTCSALCI